MIPDKPFSNIEEQIDIIASRNVRIERNNFTYESLFSTSYYTLMNGYKNTFLAGEGDNFAKGTTFEMIYTCHWLDVSLSSIILKYILLIEKSLKTKLSYIVAEKYGVTHAEYLFHKNYSNPNNSRSGILSNIKKILNEPHNGSVTNYYKTTKNHIPPWILVNDLMFGLTIKWYTILRKDDKDEISSSFILDKNIVITNDDQKEFIKKSLDMLRDFRNKVAHGSRTLNIELNYVLPKIPLLTLVSEDILSEDEYLNKYGQNDLYSIILIIFILINDSFQISNFRFELRTLLVPYIENQSDFNGKNVLELFNLPTNFFERIETL